MRSPRMLRLRNGGRKGFSLVEIVLALGIFSFAIVAIIGLMGSSLRLTRDSEERIQAANAATMLAARYQEMLKSEARGDAVNWNGFPMPDNDLNGGSMQFVDTFGRKVADVDDAAFGLVSMSKSVDIGASGAKLVYYTLQFHWPPVAADNSQPTSSYTATTAFVVDP